MTVYNNREQTQAKHFILKRYLQELAFKVLRGWDIVYVDGFSGPWESKSDNFSDTSFMIALSVLKDAQQKIEEQTGVCRKIKCFFSEKNTKAYAQMAATVAPFHQPNEKFEIKTFEGEFVDAVDEIRSFMGDGFRNTEYTALREHAKNRSVAKSRKREAREGTIDFLADFEAAQKEASIDDIVTYQKLQAKDLVLDMLTPNGSLRFTSVVDGVLEAFMLRETNVKDVCVDLMRDGKLQNTWGTGGRKPSDKTTIKLIGRT